MSDELTPAGITKDEELLATAKDSPWAEMIWLLPTHADPQTRSSGDEGVMDQAIDVNKAMLLVCAWARAAGKYEKWLDRPDVMSSVLVDQDAGHRAHWRCAIELAQLCSEASGKKVAELIADLPLKPVK